MAHGINQNKDFVAVVNEGRLEPWHRLGKRVDKAMTAKQAMKLAGLDFEVVKSPIFAINPQDEDDALILPYRYAVVKSGKGHAPEILGVVGSQYTAVQNAEAFAFMDGIVGDIGGAHYDTAGFIRPLKPDGTASAQVFLTIDLEDAGHVILDPKGAHDEMTLKLACCTSHDGSLAFTVLLTWIRIVCANTQGMALRMAKDRWVMKHTSNIAGRMDEARQTIGLTLKYQDEVVKVAEQLIQAPMSNKEFLKFVGQVWPLRADATPRQKTIADERFTRLESIFTSGANNENIRGTKWAAYQSVTEYLDWFRPVRSAANVEDVKRATDSAGFGPTNSKKHKALLMLTK